MELISFFQDLTVLYSIATIGFIAKKFGITNEQADVALTQIILYITLPALILFSMDFSFSTALLQDFVWLIFLSVYTLSFACILAHFTSRKSKVSFEREGVYQGLIIFGNQGFLGYAVCFSLFSKEGVMYASIFNLFFLFLIWTYGIYLMTRKQSNFSWKMLVLNPGILATFIGLLIFILPFKFPLIMSKFLQSLGTPTTPLSMLLIGSLIANIKKDELFKICKDKDLWVITLIKLLVIPLFIFPVVFLPVKFSILAIAILLSAMPSAPTTPIFAKKYGGDTFFGSVGVCISTLLSLFSLPLLYWLLSTLVK